MFVVYVIQHVETKELYIGKTNNLKRRLSQHNGGTEKATHRVGKDGKWILIYAEAYRDSRDASDRELKLKQRGTAVHGLKRRINRSLF
jgi:predicted GIY-YIG superfamily endonuclease